MGTKRTFNGCWTCRIRKVKCDTRQPSCLRCERAKLKCEGYDVKLTFYQSLTVQDGYLVDVAVKKSKIDKYNRRNVALSKFPDSQMYCTYSELNDKIDEIDHQVEKGVYNQMIGPFQVYGQGEVKADRGQNQVQGLSEKGKESTAMKTMGSKTSVSSSIAGSIFGSVVKDNDPIQSSKKTDSSKEEETEVEGLIHKDLETLAKLSIYGIKGPDYQIDDQNLYHILYPTFFPNIDSDEWVPKENYLNKLILSHSKDRLLTPEYFALIQEFKHIKFSFVKVPIYNHWDGKIKMLIENIMFENVISKNDFNYEQSNEHLGKLDNNGPELIKHLKVIVNLLVLSICSFNKSGNKFCIQNNSDIDDYLKIAISLRKVGLNVLNYHLDEYDNHLELHDEHYNYLLLLTIVLEIEIDTYFNIYENYELLFSIGEIILQQPHKEYAEYNLILGTLFRVMLTFYKSTQRINVYNYEITEEELTKYEDLKENYDLTKDEEYQSKVQEFSHPTIVSSTYQIVDQQDYNNYEQDDGFCPELEGTVPLTENSVYLMFGVPKSLIDTFHDIVQLANQKRVFFTEKKYPRNFPRICSEIEDKLERWQNKWHLKDQNGQYKSKLHQGLDIYIQVVHNCIRLYFKRLIKSEIHQGLIEETFRILRHLHHLNVDIKLSYWIVLILETDNTNKKDNEIIGAMTVNLDNLTYWRTKQVIFEVNDRRLIDPINWMELIREWGISLYLG